MLGGGECIDHGRSAPGHFTASMSETPGFLASAAWTTKQLWMGAVSGETSCSQWGLQPAVELRADW